MKIGQGYIYGAKGLSPYGERGLKSAGAAVLVGFIQSLPVWGEGIEITSTGARSRPCIRLSPYGERGLKSSAPLFLKEENKSLPVWGEGIEII